AGKVPDGMACCGGAAARRVRRGCGGTGRVSAVWAIADGGGGGCCCGGGGVWRVRGAGRWLVCADWADGGCRGLVCEDWADGGGGRRLVCADWAGRGGSGGTW